MMLIVKTSNFSRLQVIVSLGYKHVSICGKAPDWYIGLQYKKLAPKWSFFKDYKDGKIDQHEYTRLYNELVLSKNDPEEFYHYLERLNSDCVVLLCYEKPNEFCHRHLIANWLNFYLKLGVTEFEY